MSRHAPPTRQDFRHFVAITTRWMDNDVYGHVNNVVYYSWIDTAVNSTLIERGLLDIAASPVVAVAAESGCHYFAPVSYPDAVTVGLRVASLGRSSVRYQLGIFRNDDEAASAAGSFVHVYVDRASMRPVPMPDNVRAALEELREQ
jgi:acyl-CoA thioester hydrolase